MAMASESIFRENYYTHAIVGVVNYTLAEKVNVDPNALNYQHDNLIRTLRDMNVGVIEMVFQGPFTASLLLDRVAVSKNGVVYLPAPKSTVEEFNHSNLKATLQSELNQTVIEQKNPEARVCGADVLIHGPMILVGISETTNEAGAIELSEVFAEFPVTAIQMPPGTTHLKDYITAVGKNGLIVRPGSEAEEILKQLDKVVCYIKVYVHEAAAANCLYLNKTLIHRAFEEVPNSYRVFCKEISCSRRSICFSEFAKLNAGLSSVCLFVRKIE